MKAVYVTTYNCENNVKSASNSILLLCPCSFWSVFTRSLIYLPRLQSSFLSLKPQFIILFLSSPLLCSVSRCSPRPMLVTPWHKNQRLLLTSSLPFHHFIITSLRHPAMWSTSDGIVPKENDTFGENHTHFRSLQHLGSTWGSDVFKEQSPDSGKVTEWVSITSMFVCPGWGRTTHNSVQLLIAWLIQRSSLWSY